MEWKKDSACDWYLSSEEYKARIHQLHHDGSSSYLWWTRPVVKPGDHWTPLAEGQVQDWSEAKDAAESAFLAATADDFVDESRERASDDQ